MYYNFKIRVLNIAIYLLFPFYGYSQDTVILTFDRPSITEVNVANTIKFSREIYNLGRQNYKIMDNRADNNNLGYPSISDGDDLQEIVNRTIALIWGQDSRGNFSDSLIKHRGAYTATDQQVLTDRASEISRIGELGYKLLDKTYVFAYQITAAEDMESYYNRIDAQRRKEVDEYNSGKGYGSRKDGQPLKKFVPIVRNQQGYKIAFETVVFKIDWNDSLQNYFFSELWVDKMTNANRNNRIQKFKSWNVPYKPIGVFKSQFDETTIKSIDSIPNPKILSLLLSQVDGHMRKETMELVSRKIADFKVRTSVTNAYPILAKIGKKESLKMDDRYFIYELSKDSSGALVRSLRGWAHVGLVRNNQKMADGNLKKSIFIQHGGKKVFEGMILEEQNDIGVVLQLGAGANNAYYNGINFGAEINTSKVDLARMIGFPFSSLNKVIPGLYIGTNITLGGGINQRMGNILLDNDYSPDSLNPLIRTNVLTKSNERYNTFTGSLDFFIGKEIYFTPKGRIYLYPKAGINVSFFNITRESGTRISNISDDTKPFELNSSGGYYSLNFGYNHSPTLTYYVEPTFFSSPQFFSSARQMDPQTAVGIFSDFTHSPVFVRFGVRYRI
jgi:hypothetical protein